MFAKPKTIRCHFHFPDHWVLSDFSCDHLQTIFRKRRYLIRTSERNTNISTISKFYAINEKDVELLGQSIDSSDQYTYWDAYTPFPCVFISSENSSPAIQIHQLEGITKIFLPEALNESRFDFKHIYFPEKDSKENIKLIEVCVNAISSDLYFNVFWENTSAFFYENNDEKIIDISVCKISLVLERDILSSSEIKAHCSHICLDDNDNLIIFLGSDYYDFDRYVKIPLQELFQINYKKSRSINYHKLDEPRHFDFLSPNPENIYPIYDSRELFFFESGLVLSRDIK